MSRIKELREAAGLNMKEAARQLNIPYTTYVNYEKGYREPNSEALVQLAQFFGVTVDYLIGLSSRQAVITPAGYEPPPELEPVPLVGRIACGTPILATQNVEDVIRLPSCWRADFALRCKGDSMAPLIQDGDLVAIRKQPTVENGQIAAVRIDDEATLKRVYLSPDHLVLQAVNEHFAPIVLFGSDMASVAIEGRAVGLCRGL